VVQCKRYTGNNVSAESIQRLHSFAVTRGAEKKIVITTSNFTPQAWEEAKHAEVELINGEELATLIATHLPDWLPESKPPIIEPIEINFPSLTPTTTSPL
jgi:restriction system protein